VDARIIAGLVVTAGLGYVSFLSESRVGSVGATRWQRWFNDSSRLTRVELWPILPMFSLVAVMLLVLLWPGFGVLVVPIVVLTHRYARSHESPIHRVKREAAGAKSE
jgi:hypothetical protein